MITKPKDLTDAQCIYERPEYAEALIRDMNKIADLKKGLAALESENRTMRRLIGRMLTRLEREGIENVDTRKAREYV